MELVAPGFLQVYYNARKELFWSGSHQIMSVVSISSSVAIELLWLAGPGLSTALCGRRALPLRTLFSQAPVRPGTRKFVCLFMIYRLVQIPS